MKALMNRTNSSDHNLNIQHKIQTSSMVEERVDNFDYNRKMLSVFRAESQYKPIAVAIKIRRRKTIIITQDAKIPIRDRLN